MNNIHIIVLLALLLAVSLLLRNYSEGYTNYGDNCKPDKMCIKSLECNTVPNFPRGLRPNQIVASNCQNNFDGLTPPKGKYTFKVPELKYDGIYSKDKCKWTLKCTKPKTYSTNKLFHVPSKYFNGKTIIDQSPCSYDKFMYSRAMNLQENDIEDCLVNSC